MKIDSCEHAAVCIFWLSITFELILHFPLNLPER